MTAAPDPARLNTLLGNQIGALSFAPPRRRGSRSVAPGWVLEDLLFRDPDGQDVPAFFLAPETGPPVRAVLYCHAHGNRYQTGRDELTEGRPALQGPYLPDLIRFKIAALCIDMPCFGARSHMAESAVAKAALWAGRPLFGRMLAELSAALDWLSAEPRIDPARIGAMGISMGGTHAWWLAALDPRIRAVAHMCCFADLACLSRDGAHDGHGIYMTVPGLFPLARTGQIAGLIAPRPQLVCAGMADWSTPEECFNSGLRDLRAAYLQRGAEEALETWVNQSLGHAESPEMRAAVLDFLDRRL